MKEIVSAKNEKLVKYLTAEGYTYSAVMKALRKKDIKVNGKRVSNDMQISTGDKIAVYIEEARKKVCDQLYKDENVLIIYKYSGVTSDEVFEYLSKERTVYYIHRLDRNTDGIMIFALNKAAEEELLNGFKNRTFEKYYIAEIYGTPPEKSGTLISYLVKDGENSLVKIYDNQVKDSVKIITKYKTLERFEESTLVKVELVTGKTHQIRAHFAHIGNFIIGDGKYGKQSVNKKFKAKTQRLTAYKLVLHFNGGRLKYLDGKTTEIKHTYATGRLHS